MTRPRFTLIGFGEVGSVYAAALSAQGVPLTVFHPTPSASTLRRAEQAGITIVRDAAAAFADCDLAVNVGPGGQALAIAELAAAHLAPDALFADLSSAAPDVIRTAATLFPSGAYVDGAILGAVSIHGHRTPLLASGPGATAWSARVTPLGFSVDVMADSAPGDATTLKLVRSLLTKGMDAVIVECLLVAEAVGLREALLARLGDLDRSPFSELMAMFVRTHAPHALRRLHEMQAAFDALSQAGVPLTMTQAAMRRYASSVETLGARPALPPERPGEDLYARLLPWMLAAATRGRPDV
jgi:3-hydroxyisobutyrate dehydrogenase-like beta-hydroxyacid dehydrogenase